MCDPDDTVCPVCGTRPTNWIGINKHRYCFSLRAPRESTCYYKAATIAASELTASDLATPEECKAKEGA